jgi:hypothetical protein
MYKMEEMHDRLENFTIGAIQFFAGQSISVVEIEPHRSIGT